MRRSTVHQRQMRPYYNLPSQSEHGRKMTGFLTPYRHWMWKQNELWRNVHEAQFEHLRKVYKRQWLESFRVNADEYIHKYNITKAAQLAQWEHEMHAQERKRRESQQLAQGRQALKKKHLDLLREFHERQFFYWYERASERLQGMAHIHYIPQTSIQDHLEKELDKYVAGSKAPYTLNFVGQMPMLEDRDGNIVQVPAGLMANHSAENQDGSATVYQPPEGSEAAEEKLLQMLASAQEEELRLQEAESEAMSAVLEDVAKEEDERDAAAKVARSMEETDSEREVSRRAYIDRGKTGSRTIFRRPRFGEDGDDAGAAAADKAGNTPTVKRRRSKQDKLHALQEQQDALMARASQQALKDGDASKLPKRGEVGKPGFRVRDLAAIPTLEELQRSPELAGGSQLGKAAPRMQDRLDKRYSRGKYKSGKEGGSDGEDM